MFGELYQKIKMKIGYMILTLVQPLKSCRNKIKHILIRLLFAYRSIQYFIQKNRDRIFIYVRLQIGIMIGTADIFYFRKLFVYTLRCFQFQLGKRKKQSRFYF